MRIETVFLFDLDGTLVDSVYQHVLAWKAALDAENIELSVWRIHRKVGMSGGLFTNQLLRETGFDIDPDRIERLRRAHTEAYNRFGRDIRPLPGARELLAWLTNERIPWAIATSGRMETPPSISRRSASIPTCFSPRQCGWTPRSSARSWSATASGTCSPPPAAARSVSGS